MGKRGDTEPRENFGGDNGVIILTIVNISRNTYMSEVVIIYFKYVQFTVNYTSIKLLKKYLNLSMPQFPHLQKGIRIDPTAQCCFED